MNNNPSRGNSVHGRDIHHYGTSQESKNKTEMKPMGVVGEFVGLLSLIAIMVFSFTYLPQILAPQTTTQIIAGK